MARLTQRDLARLLLQAGIRRSQAELSRLERGQVGEVEYTSAPLMTVIGQITGVSPLWLLFGEVAVLTGLRRRPGSMIFRGTDRRPPSREPEIGTWEWDPRDDMTYWSTQTSQIFGFARPYAPLNVGATLAHILPEDRPLIRAIRERKLPAAEPFELEARLVRPDGTVRVFRGRGAPLRDLSGRYDRTVGTIEDITDLVAGVPRFGADLSEPCVTAGNDAVGSAISSGEVAGQAGQSV